MSQDVHLEPHMDSDGLAYFKEALASSSCYLEYGAGGSTVYAANVAKIPMIISVESDINWKNKVCEAVRDSKSKVCIEYCDIGEVGNWGSPKDRSKTENYWEYMAQPWTIAKRFNVTPDTVLIDGRFRVASFLFSLLSATAGTQFLFDDYFDRPAYFVVEEFCKVSTKKGRMAVFFATKDFSVPDICAKIAKYCLDVN